MTATPLPPLPSHRTPEVDMGLVTVLALAWLAAVVTTSLTLWILVGVIGSTGT